MQQIAETTEILNNVHPAAEYLLNKDNPPSLRIRYGNENRTLVRSKCGRIGIIAKGRKTKGYYFSDWDNVTKVYYPKPVKEPAPEEIERRHVLKCRKEAAKATFTNPFIRKCLGADENKSAYDNGISGGSTNSGKIISLSTIAKQHPWEVEKFREALTNKVEYRTSRIPFRGYEMTLSLELTNEGDTYNLPEDIRGYLSLEYKDCLNGYYYLLINDENFIGYEKD